MFPRVVVAEQLVVLLADHGGARSAGADDVVIRFEDFDEPLGQFLGFGVESVIEERLAAAGLGLGERDLAAEVFEDLGDGYADVRVELVGQARDKQGNLLRHDGSGHYFDRMDKHQPNGGTGWHWFF